MEGRDAAQQDQRQVDLNTSDINIFNKQHHENERILYPQNFRPATSLAYFIIQLHG